MFNYITLNRIVMTSKYIISGAALLAVVVPASAINTAFATSELTDAELQDMLGNEIHELEWINENLSKLDPNDEVTALIEANNNRIEDL